MKIQAKILLRYSQSYFDGEDKLNMVVTFPLIRKKWWRNKKINIMLSESLVKEYDFKKRTDKKIAFYNEISKILKRKNDDELIKLAKTMIRGYLQRRYDENQEDKVYKELCDLLNENKPIEFEFDTE